MRLKNLIVYTMPNGLPDITQLAENLPQLQFTECSASSSYSYGWIPPRGYENGSLFESVGGHWILRFKTQNKSVPNDVLKKVVAEKCEAIFKESARKVGVKEKKEIKEDARRALLPKAFPKEQTNWVWIDPSAKLLVIDAASQKKADAISSCIVQAAQKGFALSLMHTQTSPTLAMAQWLNTGEAPQGFSLSRKCTLKGSGSAIRYEKVTLDNPEIKQNIQHGMLPICLALNSETRPVTFTLHSNLQLRSFQFSSALFKGTKGTGEGMKKRAPKVKKGQKSEAPPPKDDNSFDADTALTTGEVAPILQALIDALDGLTAPPKPQTEENAQAADSQKENTSI